MTDISPPKENEIPINTENLEEKLEENKNLILESNNKYTELDKNGNFSFGAELSKSDNKMLTLYLDIKKIINEKPNDSSYLAFIEFNGKQIYLEPFEIDKGLYSYEYSLSIDELFTNKEDNKKIDLTILSLNIE